MARRHDRRPLALAALLVASLAAFGPVSPTTARAAEPSGEAIVTDATPGAAKPFRIDRADRNDFVAQANFVQCVGASMQMMLNIMGASDRTSRTQARLQTIA